MTTASDARAQARSRAESQAEPPWIARPYRLAAVVPGALAQPLPENALCRVEYGGGGSDDPRRLLVPLEVLSGARAGELWLGTEPARFGRSGSFSWAESGEALMVHAQFAESRTATLEAVVRECYLELGALIGAHGFRHLLRVWNYLGGINRGEGDAERYRQFCVGRFEAVAGSRGFEAQLPAASAIGSAQEGFTLMALAARRPGIQVENPRQLSAFRYPRAYGLRSPSFSRATLLPWADGAELLVSGTASIVGHSTAHAGDPQAQLEQTAVNLETLRAQAMRAQRAAGHAPAELKPQFYTLYLRHAELLPELLPAMTQRFGDAPLQVLRGDICRRELLLEVEAVYRAAPAEVSC